MVVQNAHPDNKKKHVLTSCFFADYFDASTSRQNLQEFVTATDVPVALPEKRRAPWVKRQIVTSPNSKEFGKIDKHLRKNLATLMAFVVFSVVPHPLLQ